MDKVISFTRLLFLIATLPIVVVALVSVIAAATGNGASPVMVLAWVALAYAGLGVISQWKPRAK
jgi:hypothetical protein